MSKEEERDEELELLKESFAQSNPQPIHKEETQGTNTHELPREAIALMILQATGELKLPKLWEFIIDEIPVDLLDTIQHVAEQAFELGYDKIQKENVCEKIVDTMDS